MIIPLKKYLFIGAKEDLAEFFLKAQEEGFIEFITGKKQSKEVPPRVAKLLESIKILRKQPVKSPYLGGGTLDFADEVSSQILELKKEIEKLSEEKRFLEAEIIRVAPFGKFSFEDIEFIEREAKKKIQFYCVKTSKTHEIKEHPSLIYVGTDYELDYFIGIHDRPKSYSGMIEMHFDRTADELKNHLAFVDETLHQVEAELKGFAGHIDFLRDALLQQLDIYAFRKIQKEVDFPIEGSVFAIEGWVPENKIEKLRHLIEGKAVFFEPIQIEKEDRVPTYMENKNVGLIGEDLVRFYDIPAATDKDPSLWVVLSFALFFAIIIADAGYGLIYLCIALFIKAKFPKLEGVKKRLLKLLFILSISTMIWGVFTSSYFGIQFDPKSPISKISILQYMSSKKAEYHKQANDGVYQEWAKKYPAIKEAKTGEDMLSAALVKKGKRNSYEMYDEFSDNILFEFSLLIGVIHISLGLLRYASRNWANIGWIAFAIGGYLYFPIFLHVTSLVEYLYWLTPETAATVGLQLLFGGIGFALVIALIQKRLKGAGEIAQMIQIFTDILSYLRLYALALASTIMARTANEMGGKVPLIAGAIMILCGQLVNLPLTTMSGVIHGLRLNCIEWFHWCFQGEGKIFNPLRKLKLKQE